MKRCIIILTIFSLYFFCIVHANSSISKTPEEEHDNTANQRIVGGHEATPHIFPYQAALFVQLLGGGQRSFCGGSIISKFHILTAAHCVEYASAVTVVLGVHDINAAENTRQFYFSQKFIIHQEWNPITAENDIAVVVLADKVQFNDMVQPVSLPTWMDSFRSFVLSRITISGWGKDSDSSNIKSPVLRYVNLKIIPFIFCKKVFSEGNALKQLCVEGFFGRNPCNGDSGGPAVMIQNGRSVLHGIVSYGEISGCEKGYPSVLTRVTGYLKWIQNNTGIQFS